MQNPHTPEGWSEAAEEYESFARDLTSLYGRELLEKLDLSGDHEVLEVAAGTGILTVPLAAKSRRVLATDFAPGMVERVRGRLEREGIDNVECACMDGQNLDVPDASFDRALCNFGLMIFPDRAAGFAELRRALRPGGLAAVSAWRSPQTFEPMAFFGAAVREVLPDLPAPPGPPPVFSLADPAAFEAEMAQAGFANVRIEPSSHSLEVESKEKFWETLRGSAPPARLLFSRIGKGKEDEVREALFRILDERYGDGPMLMNTDAHIAIGEAS